MSKLPIERIEGEKEAMLAESLRKFVARQYPWAELDVWFSVIGYDPDHERCKHEDSLNKAFERARFMRAVIAGLDTGETVFALRRNPDTKHDVEAMLTTDERGVDARPRVLLSQQGWHVRWAATGHGKEGYYP